jgi:exopolyphosphatase/guanosine-5'-triphosphate,3'-diphosphate pyrophosphatase
MTAARWEWRTFGEDFGAADAHFATLAPERVETSDELYLLSPATDASAKLRDGLVDAKRMLNTGDGGLEQWTPVFKLAFPLSAADVAAVLGLLRVGSAAPASGADTPAALRALADTHSDLLAVAVHKHRRRFTLGGCMAEVTKLSTDAGDIRSIAVESTDASAVTAVVRELGLQERPVVSVPSGLKNLVHFGDRCYAVNDIGTNSVKFHVAQLQDGDHWQTLVDDAQVTRLGEEQDRDGRLGAPAVARTADAVAKMVHRGRSLGAEEIAAVGTAALRRAPNAEELVRAVRERSGVDVEVLPAHEEARLAYAATVHGLETGDRSLVVFDTGGGSTQFSFASSGAVHEQFSLEVGAVRLTERFGLDRAVGSEALAAALWAIEAELTALNGRETPGAVVGMGGAITNLAAVQLGLTRYDSAAVHGLLLTRGEVERQMELYRTRTSTERRAIVGLQPDRAAVILAGACVVRSVLLMLGVDVLRVSDRGLRHGLLDERFGPARAGVRAKAATAHA